ncbi:MAG: phosphatidylglycerophosphatase A [Humidesulfovibrio sp.]|uniref:phosphatidylglycerophosphatase A family protein n=1 Tax=Humidesulfovibrio sp. TaxID=2910988 RepID=UPI0027F09D2F|nr:phosphatidylglycerophosphatase A [Humidesulfovibrio sp.]MDQ7835214.1 phosphatidylglycerophosphatase A [Humidesulfovibrio sp.]
MTAKDTQFLAPDGLVDRVALAIATLGPAGRMPVAPGTWGSALALILAPWLFTPLPLAWRLGALASILVVGAWAASRAEEILGETDPGCVVVDELLGQWTAFAPFHLFAGFGWSSSWTAQTPWELLILFGLFRLFDILKPWPIRAVEQSVPGGLGIMLDDLVAGLFAAAAFIPIRLFL